MSPAEIVELSTEETYPLRLAVLRHGTPAKDVWMAEDTWPGAIHLGLRIGEEVVATSTWIPRPHNEQPAVQLRGMATAHHLQGTGIGGQLLEAGCARAATTGVRLVWARARDAALDFYLRHEFVVEGEGFIDDATQLPHHLVVRALPA
ncbi:MAG: GNAT family N-acetyltransferase [Ilumatobacteraceae bacterium]